MCDCASTSLPTGPAGANGFNAFTVTTASFIMPAIGASVNIAVSATNQYTGVWAALGQAIYITDGIRLGYFEVTTAGTQTTIGVKNLGYTGNSAPGAVFSSGSKVSPGGLQGPTGTAGTNGVAVLADDYVEVPTSNTSYVAVKTLTLANTVFTQSKDGVEANFELTSNIAGVTASSTATVEIELNDGVNPAVLFALPSPVVAMTKGSNAFKGKIVITRVSATEVQAMLYYNVGVLVSAYATAAVFAIFQSDAVQKYTASTTLAFNGNIDLKLKLKVGTGTDETKVTYWSVIHRKK